MSEDIQPLEPRPVWDWPVRLGHWSLVGLIGVCWWSAENGHRDWHLLSGLAVLGIVVFRLIWGFIGGSTAKFAHFLRGPRTALAHLRGEGGPVVGHNPLGGWSVVALLATLAATVGFGLFSVDVDGLNSGPLSQFVSFDQGRLAAQWHHLAFDALLALIALHLAAILFYALVKRSNLLGAMITGRKSLPPEAEGLRPAAAWRLAAAVSIAGGLVWMLVRAA